MTLLKTKDHSAIPHSANHIQTVSKSSPATSSISISLSAAHFSHTSNTVPWIIDTDATDHMLCDTTLFAKITSKVHYFVRLPNGETVSVTHIGIVKLNYDILLQNVLCVSSFTFNLFSARKLSEQINYYLIFFPNFCFI